MTKLALSAMAVLSVLVVTAEARPQVFEGAGIAASGTTTAMESVGTAVGAVQDIAKDALETFRDIAEGARDFVSDAWNTGAEGTMRFNGALRDTTMEALNGVKDATKATHIFFSDGVRATGRLTADVTREGFSVARDATGATGDFFKTLTGRLVQGVNEAGDAFQNFAGDAVDNTANFFDSASGVMENVMVGGIENFSYVL